MGSPVGYLVSFWKFRKLGKIERGFYELGRSAQRFQKLCANQLYPYDPRSVYFIKPNHQVLRCLLLGQNEFN